MGTQVRGEYFAVNKKRLVRTRTKTLEFRTWKLAPEVEIQLPVSRHRILTTVRKYLDDCERELPGRYVDRGPFETLAPHVNWLALFRTR